jgi:DNA-binding CsgD family transcriptional regulator
MAMRAEQLSELIGAIYDRAVDPEHWPGTLSEIRPFLGGDNAVLSLIDMHRGAFLLNFLDNVPEVFAQSIDRWSGDIIKSWGGSDLFVSAALDEPYIWSRVITPAAEGKNSFVDAMRAAGFADSMSLVLTRDQSVIGALALGRRRKAGYFGDEELGRARLLLPHLQRAIGFSRLLELATLRASAFEAALDAVAVPTVLVTADAELVHANAAGRAELDRAELLKVSQGRIAAADLRDQRGLAQALSTASEQPAAPPTQLDVPLGKDARKLQLLPLPRGSVRGTLAPSAAAAIMLTPPPRSPLAEPGAIAARLIDRFGLTPAEAAVALEVAKGDGRAAAAARLGIRDNTVRTHLSAIFLKLGINRQAQLVRLLDDVGV